jgi:DNA-directed RNA polymerase specialized sigma24 family protein
VRETIALVSRKPVSIDAEPHDVADQVDVEGQAVVSSVLEAAAGTMAGLPAAAQVILALRYYGGVPLPDAAGLAGVKEDEAIRLHNEAVLAVHDAMLKAVT